MPSKPTWGFVHAFGFVLSVVATGTVGAACSEVQTNTADPDGGSGDPNPNGAPPGAACAGGSECRSGVCTGGQCQAPSATDGVRNGDETDVDCGGPAPSPACDDGKQCKIDGDCQGGKCDGGTCSGGGGPASPTDGKKNGTETDVDCGGADAKTPRCATGKACLKHEDCTSDGCAFDKKCASRPSCTALEGGYTCGANDVATKQGDCCESAKVGAYNVDKYQVTAGRMRAFLDRFNGNVRAWAAKLPATSGWSQANTPKLPATYDEANAQLGPFYGKRSCETGYGTGHTFWTPAQGAVDKQDLPKPIRDMKALNCVPQHMLMALCVFDGGYLAKQVELQAAYTNGGTIANSPPASPPFPWGTDPGAYRTDNDGGGYAIQLLSYLTPGTPANAPQKTDPMGNKYYLDAAIRIAPPGRRPKGYNKTGHADLVGNLLEWVSDADRRFIWKGSFEDHADEADDLRAGVQGGGDQLHPFLNINPTTGQPWTWTAVASGANKRPDDDDEQGHVAQGYYALGGRCARK